MNSKHPRLGFLGCAATLLAGMPVHGAQPGESIILDASTGNYAVTYCNPNGVPPPNGTCPLEQFVFVPATKIDPHVRSRFDSLGGAIRYAYSLRNGASSVQPIVILSLDPVTSVIGVIPVSQVTPSIDDQTLATALDSWAAALTSPPNWRGVAIVDSTGSALRVSWLDTAAQNQTDGLAPRKLQDGFRLLSADLPGIGPAQIIGNAGLPATLTDDGPVGDIGIQLQALQTNDYVARLAAVPAIQIPTPFDRAELLSRIDAQIGTWVGLGILDAALYVQIDGFLQAAISAANNSDPSSCAAHVDNVHKLLQQIYAALDGLDDGQNDKDKIESPLIARLAARVLVFDLIYAIRHP
jgi:hypothetical protein